MNDMNFIETKASRVLLLIWGLLLAGCGSKATVTTKADPTDLPEVLAVQKAFESASPSFRNPVNQTLELVKAGKINPDAYVEALPQLQKLAANTYLNADQKKTLDALIERLKTELPARR